MGCTFARLLVFSSAVTVCALDDHALAQSGTVVVWGGNSYGQRNIPTDLGPCTQISAGSRHTLALTESGVVRAWGSNNANQCNVPLTIEDQVLQIAAGGFHSLALLNEEGANVRCWGQNNYGQCVQPSSAHFIKIAGGTYHSLALDEHGQVWAWGDDYYGQCSPDEMVNCLDIAGGLAHSLAVESDGQVSAWGAGRIYSETSPHHGQSAVPTDLGQCTRVAAGLYFSLALKVDGSVRSWGAFVGTPFFGSDYSAIAAGGEHAVGIWGSQSIIDAWGGNNQFGERSVTNGNGQTLQVSAGGTHTVAIQFDYCDVDSDQIPNEDEQGPSTSTWLYPFVTDPLYFEDPANWDNGVPGHQTETYISGQFSDIRFQCDSAVKSLSLSSDPSASWSSLNFTFPNTSLRISDGTIGFTPRGTGEGSHQVNVNQLNDTDCTIISGDGEVDKPLHFNSNDAIWNFRYTSIYAPGVELETASNIKLLFEDSSLYTTSFTADQDGGSQRIVLRNSTILNNTETEDMVFGPGVEVSLDTQCPWCFDAYNYIYSQYTSTTFQPKSILDAWGNLQFTGNLYLAGQINLYPNDGLYSVRTNLEMQGSIFEYGVGASANPYASMDVFTRELDDAICLDSDTDCAPLIRLQIFENGLVKLGGPLTIHSVDGTTPPEGVVFPFIGLDPSFDGGFDPINNKFSTIRFFDPHGDGLPNGLTFEQVVSDEGLQLVCVRAPIVEPAPTSQTTLPSVPFASSSADFTGDGLDDVVNLIVGSTNSVQIMKDMGNGSFEQIRTYDLPLGNTPNAIAAGNVIGDGAPEIVITSVPVNQPYSGTISLFTATGEPIWVRQLDYNMFPTCVCVVAPSANDGPHGRIAVGTEKLSNFNAESSTLVFDGGVMSVSGDNSNSQNTPVNSVPRTVRGCDIDDDEFSDVTAAGSTSATSVNPDPQGFIQVVKMTANGSFALEPLMLDYVPVSIANADIDSDGVQDIFAANNAIPSNIPASNRPVASLMRGSINPASGQFSLGAPTGISVGLPLQGKAVSIVAREGGFSLAVASTDGANDTVDVLELNAFANGALSIGNQQSISTGGTVVGLHTLGNQVSSVEKFATVRKVPAFDGATAVIESTGYVVRLFGDLDGNGVVDTGDISMILTSYGEPGATDLDGSGVTDCADLSLLLLQIV